jgi:hypothetical protein
MSFQDKKVGLVKCGQDPEITSFHEAVQIILVLVRMMYVKRQAMLSLFRRYDVSKE